MTLWEIDIHPVADEPDLLAAEAAESARQLGLSDSVRILAARGYLLQGDLEEEAVRKEILPLLADPITEQAVSGEVGRDELAAPPQRGAAVEPIHVLPKLGVMDPVAQSTLKLLQPRHPGLLAVRTLRKYWIDGVGPGVRDQIVKRILANDSIEQTIAGVLPLHNLSASSRYQLQIQRIPITQLDDEALQRLSIEGQLYFTPDEMRTIADHYRTLSREPTDIELETIAQTWSEHCSHKTLAGRIAYRDERGSRDFENMLKETIFAATQTIRRELGNRDWCVSVFKDNAGVVKFDDEHHIVFKVETHNHPSAIEPYGGANTGLGGVIRDPLGTGLGAKPVCSTDVFCFADPRTDAASLPPGVLHPRRVMSGVVAGVRDYGNRMGIPTVNGAVYFDRRYLGNPLVYCGNAGLLPVDKVEKRPLAGDLIVAIGGRTGRDGIHGATFSSVELTEQSESISGGAVQIGNAITEKMVLDALLIARDEGLYTAVTDCGAGGFSSAIGEMGEELGAEVHLDRAPLKYDGLSYTEIWISEAQERMVLSVPPENWARLQEVCAAEGVEAAQLGTFTGDGQLRLYYDGALVGDLSMEFLHGGRPPVVRQAVYEPTKVQPLVWPPAKRADCEQTLLTILGHPNVASKHWIIRQYDHEVQGGSVIKPLVGPQGDAPSDAAVVRPKLKSTRGIVLACGMNPNYGDFDPYHMAAAAIDEAVRNAIAVGADPDRLAILDNFCWGNTARPETLGSLVRAAIACHDVAVAWQIPFISGKDSLNNEFSWVDAGGKKQTLTIPCSLLISAIGQIDDVANAISMDVKAAGNAIYLLGSTKDEFGGSLAAIVAGRTGGQVPVVDIGGAMNSYRKLAAAIANRLVRSVHDCSEGGLAVAAAEMAFGGGIGMQLELDSAAKASFVDPWTMLFAESASRLLCEVAPDRREAFEAAMAGTGCSYLGQTGGTSLQIAAGGERLIDLPLSQLKSAWLEPLDF